MALAELVALTPEEFAEKLHNTAYTMIRKGVKGTFGGSDDVLD